MSLVYEPPSVTRYEPRLRATPRLRAVYESRLRSTPVILYKRKVRCKGLRRISRKRRSNSIDYRLSCIDPVSSITRIKPSVESLKSEAHHTEAIRHRFTAWNRMDSGS